MLLNSVVIVLREVLEASILMGLFLAFSQRTGISRIWILASLFLGSLLAAVYAINISTISNWFEGVGQEVVNAGMQFLIYIILLLFSYLALSTQQQRIPKHHVRALVSLIIIGVVLASLREGCEIILYISGFSSMENVFQPVLFGSAIGAGIGMSVGVCIYYLLVSLPPNYGKPTGFILTMLIAGGMLSQAVQQLIQADWIVSQYPLWDSSHILSEHSVTGQLLYALIGYEATPTPIQVSIYAFGIVLMLAVFLYHYWLRKDRLCV